MNGGLKKIAIGHKIQPSNSSVVLKLPCDSLLSENILYSLDPFYSHPSGYHICVMVKKSTPRHTQVISG